jgi:hypothetical protein
MKKKNKYLFIFIDIILSIFDLILDLILDLIFILIFFIGPDIRKYLIFFFMVKILIFLFDRYSLYFGIIALDLDALDFFLAYLYDLINNIRDIINLDFYFVMLILYSIFAKDVTLFNYLFWFFILYLYIFR